MTHESVIFFVGVLGNVMVVMVVRRTTSMHSPTNCYLMSLAVADCLTLIASVPNEIIGYYVLGDEWIWGQVGCATFIFLQYFGINVSSLSITAFTVERYIAICHPLKAQTICTLHRAKRIVLGVWIFATLYCLPWLLLTKTVPLNYRGFLDRVKCTFALTRHHYLGYFFTDLVLFYVIPLILSCVLYGLIARVLFTNELIPNIRTKKKKTKVANNNGCQASASTSAVNAGSSANKKTNSCLSARIQVIKMLIVVVVLFATLWMPYRVFLVYNSLAKQQYMELWFLMFAKTMVYINCAINPILYNVMSVKFRNAFRRMLACEEAHSHNYEMSMYRSVYCSNASTSGNIRANLTTAGQNVLKRNLFRAAHSTSDQSKNSQQVSYDTDANEACADLIEPINTISRPEGSSKNVNFQSFD